ncbi:MAG: hypothetical protein JJU06_01565 [Ectothiorhodospiraceae bacterium]|nr:hypothetical protein [Ectothiorhodospiraceae bacterium]
MPTLIENSQALIYWGLGSFSLLMFLGTLVLVPMIVVRIPADYFAGDRREKVPVIRRHPLIQAALVVAKNVLGLILVLLGLAMLVLPGQGVITILIGLMLMNFPGKYRLEKWVISRRPVRRSINWLRVRAGRPRLVLDRPRRRRAPPPLQGR